MEDDGGRGRMSPVTPLSPCLPLIYDTSWQSYTLEPFTNNSAVPSAALHRRSFTQTHSHSLITPHPTHPTHLACSNKSQSSDGIQ
ncbi:hypothetical protein E2C01_069110 [Portunus trituberculatus]|uniref:Uncharacterized protein n=1 Tax=Portunus trituberculatus TaxID=210409 RepID=A0A5B7HYD4_PORTR|nr:hypothetical protein [Portunus trituberculatus]